MGIAGPNKKHRNKTKAECSQRGGPIGAGYPDEEEGAEIVSFVAAAVEGLLVGAAAGWVVKVAASAPAVVGGSLLTPLSKGRGEASNLGVMSPGEPLIMPRPGIIGVFRELEDALPLTPNGNLDSKAPERELEEVLGRVAEVPKEPKPLPWLLGPFESCSSSMPESFQGLR